MFQLSFKDVSILQKVLDSLAVPDGTPHDVRGNVTGCNGGCGYSCSAQKG